MDRLSNEILALIINSVRAARSEKATTASRSRQFGQQPDPPKQSASFFLLATVNRGWQAVVEAYTFATIKLISSELDDFTRIFGTARDGQRRRRALRRLNFDVLLPEHNPSQRSKVDSNSAKAENSAAFERAVMALFKDLASWTNGAAAELGDRMSANLTLSIKAHSAMDPGYIPKGIASSFGLNMMVGSHSEISSRVAPSVVEVVRGYQVPNGRRKIAVHTLMRILESLKGVETVDISLSMPDVQLTELHRKQRAALAQGFSSLILPSLRDLKIDCDFDDSKNPRHPIPSLLCPSSPDVDSLSTALCNIASSQLTSLVLDGPFILSPALFTRNSDWPTLQRLVINASSIAPDGRSYFTSAIPAAQAPDDGDQGSTRPDSATFDGLACSIATSVLRMRALRYMSFQVGMSLPQPSGVLMECAEAAEAGILAPDGCLENKQDLSVRRWKYWVGNAGPWDVPPVVDTLWREWVGCQGMVVKGRWPGKVAAFGAGRLFGT